MLLSSPILLFPATVNAQEYFFQEEFNENRANNTLDSNKWDYFTNNTPNVRTIWENDGLLRFWQQPNTNQFPFVVSKNSIIPSGNFEFEMAFQYTLVTPWGTGLTLSENSVANGEDLSPMFTIGIWQDQSVGPSLRIGFDGNAVFNTPANTAPHLLKVSRNNKVYSLYLDGTLIYTSPPTDKKVNYLWLGNPSLQNPSIPEWTRFNVDYIRVKDLGAEPLLKTPLILIPGIGGSELRTKTDIFWNQPNGHGGNYSKAYPAGETVWLNESEAGALGDDDYFDVLKMKTDGTSLANLEPTGNLYSGVYQGTINFLTENGYTLNQTLFLFPYDWRKDIALTAPLLDQKIEEIKQKTGTSQVDLLAHSMGGLVARNYIKDSQKASKVRKLIELGVPHLGSVKAIKTLFYGDCLTKPLFDNKPFCLGINESEVKDVSQNMISSYQLLPTKKYFEFYNGTNPQHPYPIKDDTDKDNNKVTGSLNYLQTKDFLKNLGYNINLLTPSESFHQIDDTLSQNTTVDISVVAGSGTPTIGQVQEKKSIISSILSLAKQDPIMINGDKTVPLFSASLVDSSTNKSLLGNAKIFYTKQAHNELISDGPALHLVNNILADETTLPEMVSVDPFPLKGIQESVHSPVNILVIDNQGRKTGIDADGTVKEEIPGATFETLDETKLVWLPEDGTYITRLSATGNGYFDFKVRRFDDDQITKSTVFTNISVSNTTKATSTINSLHTDSVRLQIDQDGDGSVDEEKKSPAVFEGTEYTDTQAPEASLSFNTSKKELDSIALDNIPGAYTTLLKSGIFLVQDLAGNTTEISPFFSTNKSSNKIKQTGSIQLTLNQVKYGNSKQLSFPENSLKINYTYDISTNKFSDLSQNLSIKNQIEIKAEYNPKDDTTAIEFTEYKKKKVTQVKPGLVVVRLKTKNGTLIYEF